MGKSWDGSKIAYNVELWTEALRVLKPGGHLLAFSGSRTYHRMTCAIEDAGFEVRDQIMWLYGSGFPKSLDVSKAIDKSAGAEREVVGVNPNSRPNMVNVGATIPSPRVDAPLTAPATDAARQWDGWGTALKPAHEPICVARKPLTGTVAANVLAHGTGALNIDGCRVGDEDMSAQWDRDWQQNEGFGNGKRASAGKTVMPGRWPANVIHDGSDEVRAAFPDAGGQQGALTGDEPSARAGAADQNCYGVMDRRHAAEPRREIDKSAARFFYVPKASKSDREEGLEAFAPETCGDGRTVAADNAYQRGKTERQNTHPTVKPTDLMAYLCRLVTPPGGLVLDPFAGSGSTGKAAIREGFQFIGIEQSAEYVEIACARIAHEMMKRYSK